MNQKNYEWLIPAKAPELNKNEIHIWRTNMNFTAHSIDHFYLTLSHDEKSKANRFRFEKDKKRFIITRGLLRKALGHYLNIKPEDLIFIYNKYGKPSLTISSKYKLEFNLSHSADVILYAFAKERRVGIDVERLRPIKKTQRIVDRFFSETEKRFYNSQNTGEREKAFFKLWTYKEAYTKAKGIGLTLPLNQIDVPFANKTLPRQGLCDEQWSWHEIEIDSDYLAALATEGNDFEISHWKIDNI